MSIECYAGMEVDNKMTLMVKAYIIYSTRTALIYIAQSKDILLIFTHY